MWAKNFCSFVSLVAQNDCCGSESGALPRGWNKEHVIVLQPPLHCCATTSAVDRRAPAQAYVFTSAGAEDVPHGNCWWICLSRLAMACYSVEEQMWSWIAIYCSQARKKQQFHVLRLLTLSYNLQNFSVRVGFCSHHHSCRYPGLAGPCLTEGHKEQGGTMAQVIPCLWAEGLVRNAAAGCLGEELLLSLSFIVITRILWLRTSSSRYKHAYREILLHIMKRGGCFSSRYEY